MKMFFGYYLQKNKNFEVAKAALMSNRIACARLLKMLQIEVTFANKNTLYEFVRQYIFPTHLVQYLHCINISRNG